MSSQQMLLGAGGKIPLPYVDTTYHTSIYVGTGSSQNIVTGFKPDMVWIKQMNVNGHRVNVYDSVRGVSKELNLANSSAEVTSSNNVTSFNSDGFTVGTGVDNTSGTLYVAHSFKKQAGFMDIIEWTGDGNSQSISHDLGCTPRFMLIKKKNSSQTWG